jgi:two-component system, LytTR family, response regulator
MKRYKSIIVEDEDPAKERLIDLLKDYPQIEILTTAADGLDAIEKINSLKPDLIFLDIQIPEWNGFQVLNAIEVKPLVIFTTAYDNYLMEAFDEKSVSYLLKPIEKEQLEKAISKLRDMFPIDNKELNLVDNKNNRLDRLVSKIGNRIKLFPCTDVFFLKAEDKQCFFYTDKSSYAIDYSLNNLEEMLPEFFIRIHRSLIVNTNYINQIEKTGESRCIITLSDLKKTELESGKSYYSSIRAKIGF